MRKFIKRLREDRYLFNVLVCVAILLILASIPILLVQFRNFNLSQISTVYQVNLSRSSTDKVKLKENNVFVNNSGDYYVSDFYVSNLVDAVHIDFNNSVNFYTTNYNVDYTKQIKATLIVDGSEGVILEENATENGEEYYLQESGHADNSSSIYYLNEEVEFDYDRLCARLSEIQASCDGITCYGTVEIEYTLSCVGTLSGENFSYYDTMRSYFPIETSGTMSVDHTLSQNREIDKTKITYYNDVNYLWLVVGFLADIVALGIITLIVIAVVQAGREKASQRYIQKILSQYNDILVKIDAPLKSKVPVLRVSSFDDLVKVETELSLPITWYFDGNTYNFYVYSENVTYSFEYQIETHENLQDEREESINLKQT